MRLQVSMSTSNYTQPVTVPVNISYGESGLLQSSPQMAHTSISPRPSSSETDSVYPSGGMLEMSNGYPNSASPMGGSPSPGPSPGPGMQSAKQHVKQHSPIPRSNLRVVIPTPLSLASEDVQYGEVSILSQIFTPLRGSSHVTHCVHIEDGLTPPTSCCCCHRGSSALSLVRQREHARAEVRAVARSGRC